MCTSGVTSSLANKSTAGLANTLYRDSYQIRAVDNGYIMRISTYEYPGPSSEHVFKTTGDLFEYLKDVLPKVNK